MEKSANSETAGGSSEPDCYPLNTDDYKRLQKLKAGGVHIVQTVVPALCDVERVEISEHNLSTIPLKAGLGSDPDAVNLLSPEGIIEHEAEEQL